MPLVPGETIPGWLCCAVTLTAFCCRESHIFSPGKETATWCHLSCFWGTDTVRRANQKMQMCRGGTVWLTVLPSISEMPLFYSWLSHGLMPLCTTKLTLFSDCSTICKMGMIMLSTTKGQCNSLLINIYKVPDSPLLCTFAVIYICAKWGQSGWKMLLYFIPTLC